MATITIVDTDRQRRAAEPTRRSGTARALDNVWPALAAGLLAALLLGSLLGFQLWRDYRRLEIQAFRETSTLTRVLGSHVTEAVRSVDQMLQVFAEQVGKEATSGPFDADRIEQESQRL